jgi:hypothetical protein
MWSRFSAFAFVLASLAFGANPLPARASPQSDWSRLPLEVRRELHLSTNQVPPYPESDPRLLNARSWPKARVFDGKEYALEYVAWQWGSDVGTSIVHSISEIDSGWIYGARYVRYSRSEKYGSRRGPYFEWYPDSSLYNRTYYTAPSSWRSWYYDRQGNLRAYDVALKGSGCNPGWSCTELFATDGSLVGCQFPRLKKYYWMGGEIQSDEYIRRLKIFNKWGNERYMPSPAARPRTGPPR